LKIVLKKTFMFSKLFLEQPNTFLMNSTVNSERIETIKQKQIQFTFNAIVLSYPLENGDDSI
jgi:hypothetical protein